MPFLLRFLNKYGEWGLFFLLQAFALVLIYRNNPYQNHAVNRNLLAVKGAVFENVHNRLDYFNLRKENDRLAQANLDLMRKVDSLQPKKYRSVFPYSDTIRVDTTRIEVLDSIVRKVEYTIFRRKTYDFIGAEIINQTYGRKRNFQILDKGTKDGVKVGMSVITDLGVSGLIQEVTEHYSVAASFLNPDTKVFVEKVNGDAYGPLVWDGRSPKSALLNGIPVYQKVEVNDTLFTSTNSSYPSGIPMGRVVEVELDPTTREQNLHVELFQDFSLIKNVYIVGREKIEEISELQNFINAQ